MIKYTLDINIDKNTFANISIDEYDIVKIGTYDDGKITRSLHNLNKSEVEALIKALQATILLLQNN